MIDVIIHSAIKISEDKIIYVDPFMLKEESHDADIILVTHDHYDHFSRSDIDKIIKEDTVVVAPESMKLQMNDYKNIVLVKPNEKINVLGVEIETVPAYNVSKRFHPKENNWVGYIVLTSEGRVYISGDTDENEDILKVECDIALVPVGGTYTFDAMEAVHFINQIKPRKVIPTHYGSAVGEKNCGEVFAKHVSKDIEVEVIL